MENENLGQYRGEEKRIKPKINVSKDGKWEIIRIPGIEQPIIKAVAYFRATLHIFLNIAGHLIAMPPH